MSSNKMNAKTKGKDDKAKTKGAAITTNEDQIIDLSLLRKPITNCVTNFVHAKKIYDSATEECKNIISQECDLLYECKVCRSIFRSILNFISHKRIYCKDKFNSDDHGHFMRPMTLQNEIRTLTELQKSIDEKSGDSESRIPLTKDLTDVIEAINTKRGVPINKQKENLLEITFQKINTTNNAVYQSVNDEQGDGDNMKDQVNEIEGLLNQDIGVLQDDGKLLIQNSTKPLQTDTVIQISDDEDETQSLVCKICNVQFSTVKTLKFHVKYKHLESRLVYPCPDCVDIFCTSWSVYRHLFKVHRKSAAQIRRMRESIQSKAFKMNNPPAYFEKRKNIIKTANMQKIADRKKYGQTWLENMENDGEVPRCGGCGRMFERRAALVAHTNTCQPRNRALTRKLENKRIEIQIRRDYNKTPTIVPPNNVNSDPVEEIQEIDTPMDVDEPVKETPIIEKLVQVKPVQVKAAKQQSLLRSDIFEQKATTENDKVADKSNEPEKVIDITEEPKICMSELVEQRNFEGLKMKMLSDVNLDTLTCKKCQNVSTSMTELAAHMARHYKWSKYSCKLCNYKDYVKKSIMDHVRTVHKLYGDEELYLSTIKVLEPADAVETVPTPTLMRIHRVTNKMKSLHGQPIEPTKQKRKLTRKQKKNDKDDESSNDISSRSEENSSDMDEIEDKTKKQSLEEELLSVISSRRPVRKRSKPKNDDFEYDLSNLLKMEAQGYKDSQTTSPRAPQAKKKVQSEPVSPVNEPSKEHLGTLLLLSKQAVEKATAKVKQLKLFTSCSPRNQRTYSVFIKPPVPKLQFDKEVESTSPTKGIEKEAEELKKESNDNITMVIDENGISDENNILVKEQNNLSADISMNTIITTAVENMNTEPQTSASKSMEDPKKTQLPIKVPRKSFEIIRTPSPVNSTSTESKSAVIPKVIVIKPINRKKVGNDSTNVGSSIKYKTIKLKSNKTKEGLKIVKITSKPTAKLSTENTQNKVLTTNNTSNVHTETISATENDTTMHQNGV